MRISQEVLLFITGAGVSLAIGLITALIERRPAFGAKRKGIAREREQKSQEEACARTTSIAVVKRTIILLLMIPFNPFLLLGKTLALGRYTGTGLYYLILQMAWYILLVAVFGSLGWLAVGFAMGLHVSAILWGWEFYLREE